MKRLLAGVTVVAAATALAAAGAASAVLPAAATPTWSAAATTTVPYNWSSPTWSTNGTLAFIGGALNSGSVGLFVARRTGTHLRRVAVSRVGGLRQSPQDLSWSPRGTKIVWSHRYGEAAPKVRIVVADTRRGAMRAIAHGLQPAWAPRGGLVAYKGFPGIHLIRPDGRGDRRLTQGALDGSPSWSPDGHHLVFTRRAGTLTGDGPIYVIRSDGKQLRKLTPQVGNHPVWSPDGRQIAFDVFDHVSGASAIYVIDADGSHEHRLSTSFTAAMPVWSPDSARLAFRRSVRANQEEQDVAVIARDGSGGEHFLGHPGSTNALTWSPDSRWIAYDAWPQKCRAGGIHVIRAAGGRPTEITPCRYRGR